MEWSSGSFAFSLQGLSGHGVPLQSVEAKDEE